MSHHYRNLFMIARQNDEKYSLLLFDIYVNLMLVTQSKVDPKEADTSPKQALNALRIYL